MTVMFELTKHQTNQIQALGHALWPDQHLHRDEICRRVLLDAADQRLRLSYADRLLEEVCRPSQKPSIAENSNHFLIRLSG